MALIELFRGNEMEFQKKIGSNSESNFAQTFFDHLLLSDINFDRHCLINNNISVLEKVINLYFLYTLSACLKS